MYLSKLTFEKVVSFAVLGTLLEAQMPLLHPRASSNRNIPFPQTRFLQKQKLYFSLLLSPIFPNILSSCKWVLHRRRVIGNTPLDIWQILVIKFLFNKTWNIMKSYLIFSCSQLKMGLRKIRL